MVNPPNVYVDVPAEVVGEPVGESVGCVKESEIVEDTDCCEGILKTIVVTNPGDDNLGHSSDEAYLEPRAPTTPPPKNATTMIGSPPCPPFEEPSFATMFFKQCDGQSMRLFIAPVDIPESQDIFKTNMYTQEWNNEDSWVTDYCMEPLRAGDFISFYQFRNEGVKQFKIIAKVLRVDPDDKNPVKVEGNHFLPWSQTVFRVAVVVQVGEKYQLMKQYGVGREIQNFNLVRGWIEGKECHSGIMEEAGCFSDIFAKQIKNANLDGPIDLLRTMKGGRRSKG